MTLLDLPRLDTTAAKPSAPQDSVFAPDTSVLVGRVRSLLSAGRTGAARPLLAALRRVNPGDPRLAELDARLKLREGDAAGACSVLDAAIAASHAGASDAVVLYKMRVEARSSLNDKVGACQDAAEALTLDRNDTEAKALLGLTLAELGHHVDALACLSEASRERPSHPSIRLGLAQAQERTGDPDEALATLEEGILLLPSNLPLRNAAIMLLVKLERFAAAVTLAEATRSVGVADACTFGLLGHALSRLGHDGEATGAYAEALKLAPEDPYIRHLVASGGRVASADRAPLEYVRTLFDGYAGEFEQHLLGLAYRVPGLIRRVLESRAEADAVVGPVLDLGCGTGLLAVACLDLPFGPWVGVDASSNMLSGAQDKNLYAELTEDDLIRFLAADDRLYPVILAGDVLCYFGKLDNVFAAAAERLAPGGAFVLSLECHSNGPAAELGQSGRWAHSEDHVRAAAHSAGLRCASLEHEILRLERELPVNGMLVVLERAGTSSADHAGGDPE